MKKETIVYVSDECLELVEGCNNRGDMIKIYNFKKYPFAEGTLINGIITDDFEFRNTLRAVHEDGYKSIRLVINSGQIINKLITVPKMNAKQILQVVTDEINATSNGANDLVIDYAYAGESTDGKHASKLFCVGVERTMLNTYITAFTECELEVLSIDTYTNAMMKVVKEALNNSQGRYLLSTLNGNNLISILFDDGEYQLSYRTRILSFKGTEAFVQEITRNISQIAQFSRSGENSKDLEKVYFCYLDEQKDEVLAMVNDALNLETSEFPESPSIYIVDETNKENFCLSQYFVSAGMLFKM